MNDSLQKINEIDDEINRIHSELAGLYKARTTILTSHNSRQLALNIRNSWEGFNSTVAGPLSWTENEYQKLIDSWSMYGLDLPPLEKMRPLLLKARETIIALTQDMPELKDKLEVVLIPPTKLLGFPPDPQLRETQSSIDNVDEINENLPAVSSSKKWRMLVVYSDIGGLYLDTPQRTIKEKKYIIAGHDAAKLGLREYLAFSLQRREPADTNTWTFLPGDYDGGEVIPVVALQGGRFRFDLEDVSTIFGDVRFRPAVEIEV